MEHSALLLTILRHRLGLHRGLRSSLLLTIVVWDLVKNEIQSTSYKLSLSKRKQDNVGSCYKFRPLHKNVAPAPRPMEGGWGLRAVLRDLIVWKITCKVCILFLFWIKIIFPAIDGETLFWDFLFYYYISSFNGPCSSLLFTISSAT